LAGTVVFAALDDAAAAGVVVGFGALVGAAACVELVLAGVAFAALDDATVAGAVEAAVLLLDAAPLPPQAASTAIPPAPATFAVKRSRRRRESILLPASRPDPRRPAIRICPFIALALTVRSQYSRNMLDLQDKVLQSRTGSGPAVRPRGAPAPRDHTVQAIVRAFAVLEAFRGVPSLSVTEAARVLGMHKSMVHRLLATLEQLGYVVHDEPTQRYRLGAKVLDLAAAGSAAMNVRTLSLPVMKRLVSAAQETVHLGVLIDGEVVCIESVASERPVAMQRVIGKHGPAHVSSMGKVLLAYQPEEVVARVILEQGLPRLTDRTITDPELFREHLALVCEQGWAFNAEEEALGEGCIAAPIWSHGGEVTAAVSIAAPSARLAGPYFERLRELVHAAAAEISAALGYPANP
jgi:DNA-binding IclR family transcriptional regulator